MMLDEFFTWVKLTKLIQTGSEPKLLGLLNKLV